MEENSGDTALRRAPKRPHSPPKEESTATEASGSSAESEKVLESDSKRDKLLRLLDGYSESNPAPVNSSGTSARVSEHAKKKPNVQQSAYNPISESDSDPAPARTNRCPAPEPDYADLWCRNSSAALTAGAFQDHLLHELAIGDLSLACPLKSYEGLKQKLKNDEKKRRNALKHVKPTVDTGRTKRSVTKTKATENDREYVLDPLPKPSLAQKMGLVPQPDKPLTSEEWISVKQRSIDREDFKNPCAICQEHFRTEDQVLLSCSHVFHKACIQAFERFTGKKTCPMCRKIQYQARVVHDGTREFRIKAAVRIQTMWRGYVVRKWYKELRRTHPPKDPRLRQKFFENKLQEITNRMVAMTSTETVDRFLRDIDESVATSRRIFQHFEDSCLNRLSDDDWMEIELKALVREDKDCPICLRSLVNTEPNKRQPSPKLNDHSKPSEKRLSPNRAATNSAKCQQPTRQNLSLLSCSHLFHAQCLEALEDFCILEMPNVDTRYSENLWTSAIEQRPDFKCPVCRSLYVKKIL